MRKGTRTGRKGTSTITIRGSVLKGLTEMRIRVRGIALIVIALGLGVASTSSAAQNSPQPNQVSSVTPEQLAASDLLTMKFAAGSNPSLSYEQAAAVQDWPANVTRVECVISDRKDALVVNACSLTLSTLRRARVPAAVPPE